MSGATEQAQVQIDAHVIRQLGDQLVTDAEQALIELIKNCWDADAKRVRVLVDPDYQDEKLPDVRGRLVVEDDGTGMDHDTIKQGWLTISLSPKREMKKQGKVSKLGRTPLGDKGLGRLGTMKLGDIVDITTHYDPKKPGYFVSLTWSDFQSGKVLSKIPVTLDPIAATGRTGTSLQIKGLVDPDYWRGERRLREIQIQLSMLVSPFEDFANFKLTVNIDGKSVALDKISTQLRETAMSRFSANWSDRALECSARVKLALFRTASDDAFEKWVTADSGKSLLKYLSQLPGAPGYGLTKGRDGWFIELSRQWDWSDLASKRPGTTAYDKPGPFVAELDSFELDETTAEQDGLFSRLQDYRAFVRRQAGVTIYRDGFGIRMEDDWLKLGQSWTSGKSFYGLKPGNTIGYVAITAKSNSQLAEKSDREGFIDSPASRGFFELMETFVKFANDALNFLRRSYNAYKDERAAEEASLPPKWEPADAIDRLKQISKSAKERRQLVGKVDEARKAGLEKVRANLTKALSASDLPSRVRNQMEDALAQFDRAMKELDERRQELTDLTAQLADEEKLAAAILDRFGQMREQTDDVYEIVALGLVAQALAHDLHALIDDLLLRTQKISRKAKTDPQLAGYFEAVRATSNAVRKQLTFLDPMLRSARETRQVLSVGEFVAEFIALREERLERIGIKPVVTTASNFSVRINRGRLLQVFDNLFRNSEYWLRQYEATHPKAPLQVHVEIGDPFVTVWDTAAGVKPALERTLFDLFVTDKPRGEGSGLGLFIVKQLLERENCSVLLDPERNKNGRRFRFTIDFSGARHDG